jgi:hypothetical protein
MLTNQIRLDDCGVAGAPLPRSPPLLHRVLRHNSNDRRLTLVQHLMLTVLGVVLLVGADQNAALLSAFWRNETRALNGTRTLARKLVQGLEALTGRRLAIPDDGHLDRSASTPATSET